MEEADRGTEIATAITREHHATAERFGRTKRLFEELVSEGIDCSLVAETRESQWSGGDEQVFTIKLSAQGKTARGLAMIAEIIERHGFDGAANHVGDFEIKIKAQ